MSEEEKEQSKDGRFSGRALACNQCGKEIDEYGIWILFNGNAYCRECVSSLQEIADTAGKLYMRAK